VTVTAWEVAARDFEVERPPSWRSIARPEQLPPDGEWLVWLFLAGRGAGKTRAAAEFAIEKAREMPRSRGALIARTPADVRDVQIEGESGILACSAPDFMPVYEPTKRRLTWPNGSMATAFSAEVPSQLRGPQHHWAWADETSSWTDARKGDEVDTAWNNLMLGLRLGQSPRCAVTTTPKANALTKAILKRKTTAITKGTTYDNLANLAPSFREEVLSAYEGTRIGRQELLGEMLEDVEGALWTVALIDANRVRSAPDLRRVVVAVDPSGGSGPHSDEQGIIVAGLGVDGHVYILADRSCRLSPNGWASRAVAAYHEFGADRIVAERNFGGDMVRSTIGQVDGNVPVKMVTASRGKVQRAEPVAAAYEQGRVHHVGALAKLEDQMVMWTPADGTSPDRMDAAVWSVHELTGNFGADAWLAWAKRKAEEASGQRPESSAVPGLEGTGAAGPNDEPGTAPDDPGPVRDGADPGTWLVRSSDGQRDYTVTADGRCTCQAGSHGRRCRHVPLAHAGVDPVKLRKLVRDAAYRAANNSR
jgi:phage terminase large subunit-like protein